MRKKRVYKKHYQPDFIYNRLDVGRFINYLMQDGNKATASKVFYDALEDIKTKTKEKPIEIFEKALENAAPLLEVASKRIGGANYQIPREVRAERRFFLACKWIIEGARSRKGQPMAERLAQELMEASKNEGSAIKKKQNTHRMAEANRAFAHFAR